MHAGRYLSLAGRHYRTEVAVVDAGLGLRLSYREFDERVNSLANGLAGLGVRPGERVASLSPNRFELLIVTYACYKAGYVLVPLNARLSGAELVHVVNNCSPAVLIAHESYLGQITGARSEMPSVAHVIGIGLRPRAGLHGQASGRSSGPVSLEELIEAGEPHEPDVPHGLPDLLELRYTSGTTGTLKAAMITQRVRLAAARKILAEHPAVLESAVIGIPDERWGESVKAFVVLRADAHADEAELIEFCRHRLSSYKKPKSVEFTDLLPKSPVGKILRRSLRDPYWTGRERPI